MLRARASGGRELCPPPIPPTKKQRTGAGEGTGIEWLSPTTVLNGWPRKFWKLSGKRDMVQHQEERNGVPRPLPSALV